MGTEGKERGVEGKKRITLFNCNSANNLRSHSLETSFVVIFAKHFVRQTWRNKDYVVMQGKADPYLFSQN